MAGAATRRPGPPPSAAAPGTTEPAAAAQDNALFADLLREMAALLEAQGDNAFRVAAYRNAAEMIAAQPRSLREVFESEGLAGLDALPTIGPGIASAIAEIVQTGRWGRLDRLRGAADVEAVFHTIPGVGMTLAHRLHDELGVDSLESLEVAARDGRLERLPQIGPRRAAAIRASLTQMLDRTRALRRTQARASRGHRGCSENGRRHRGGAADRIAAARSIKRTAQAPRRAPCQRLRRAASTRKASPGCQCCTPGMATGTSPRCSRTPRGRTNWGGCTTGS